MKTGMLSAAVLAGSSLCASAGITIDVVASSAPNVFGSPSWSGYLANALNSLEFGLGNLGDRNTDPTAYEIAGATVSPGDFMVSSFNSWRGNVNPTGAFANELGNRMHFGLHAVGDGITQFALENVSFSITSSDSANSLGFTGDFTGLGYSSTRFGIDWGADRVKGGGDDIIYASGHGSTLVDEIVYVGIGNAFWPGGGDPDPSNPVGGAQAAMDDAIAYVLGNAPFSITGTYNILSDTGTDTVTVIPAPASAVLLLGAGLLRRRRHGV